MGRKSLAFLFGVIVSGRWLSCAPVGGLPAFAFGQGLACITIGRSAAFCFEVCVGCTSIIVVFPIRLFQAVVDNFVGGGVVEQGKENVVGIAFGAEHEPRHVGVLGASLGEQFEVGCGRVATTQRIEHGQFVFHFLHVLQFLLVRKEGAGDAVATRPISD